MTTLAPAKCRTCKSPTRRPTDWYCTAHDPLHQKRSQPTPAPEEDALPTPGPLRANTGSDPGWATPTETDIPRLLDIAARRGIAVYTPDRFGNLIRRTTQETS